MNNNINNAINAINNMSSDDVKNMFDNLYGKSNQAVNEVVDVVKENIMSDETKAVVNAVKNHAITACKNSYDASKEAVIITAVASAAGSVYATKHVAEATKKLADVTSKKSKMFASWILAQ